MAFEAWLLQQKDRGGPIGDLADDVARDRSFPDAGDRLSVYVGHLERRGACEGAIKALREAWAEWGGAS